MAQSQVYSLLQDSRGYLWMGTRGGGISRFDGGSFKNFSQKDGLSNNYVFCIREDASHNLWIGTNNGLSLYNGVQFTNFIINHNPQISVLDIAFDEQGRKWLATNLGVWMSEGDSFRNISLAMHEKENMINTICVDRSGKIWYGTAVGLSSISSRNGHWTNEKTYRNHPDIRVSVNAIKEGPDGNLWLGTYNNGVYLYRDNRMTRFGNNPELDKQSVFDICFDQNNTVWLATLNRGICQYHTPSANYTWLGESEGLSNNHVRSVIQDKSGNFWFGTSGGGVCHYFGKQFTTYDKSLGLAGNFVYSIYRDKRQRLLVGTSDKGLSVYDSARFKTHNAANGFYDVKIKAIIEDLRGTIYLGTEANGVFIFHDSGFTPLAGLEKKYIRAMCLDQLGNVYIATAGTGIYKLGRSSKDSSLEQLTTVTGLLSNRISCLHADKKGQIWYGTENSGFGVLDNGQVSDKTFTIRNGLPINAVRCMTEDKKGYLWIGTAGGGIVSLPLYQDDFRLIPFNGQDALTSNNIYLLTTDEHDHLFIGTETGLDRISLDPSDKTGLRHYSKGEGFTGIETCQNAVLNDSNGTIWFGTINGLTRYIPTDKFRNEQAPVLSITDIRLFYEPIAATIYKDHAGDWNIIRPLELPYNQNHLTFDFMGINLSNPEAVSYRWKLEGFDKDWSPESKQRTVTYSNLPNGDYVFLVKSCNEDGVWNTTPETFKFNITAPVWMRWWFIALTLLTVIFIIVISFRWRIRSIRRKAEQARQKLQLEKELLELEQKALRLQMNPHFIFNALNSIQSQIGTDNEQAARYYLAKFSRLMRQILDHSRHTTISLQEEINTLENYLLIEKFCNGDRFDYSVNVDPHIDKEDVQTPPMLLQPFIENAIKHGLRFMDNRRGTIIADITEKHGILECCVTDNGIGRVRSAELNKNSKETYHESVALKVTQERLDLMQQDEHITSLEIIDLYDEENQACGTKVIIRIRID